MVEQRWHRPSLVGPAILIFVGIAFLLGNLGLLRVNWWDLLRLWPAILILAGLDILARHSRLLSAVLAVAIIAALGGLFYVLVTSPELLQHALAGPQARLALYEAAEDLGGARQVDVAIRMGTGRLELTALDDSPRLFEGDLRYREGWSGRRPEVSYSVSGERGQLAIESRSVHGWVLPFGSSPGGEQWTIGLTREVPLNISVDAGASQSLLDLRHLRLQDLRVKAGVGRMEVFFPAEGERMTAHIEGGVGQLVLHVPESVQARVRVSGGLGNKDLAERFRPIGDEVYETAGYASAASRLDIRVEGGIGALRVQ